MLTAENCFDWHIHNTTTTVACFILCLVQLPSADSPLQQQVTQLQSQLEACQAKNQICQQQLQQAEQEHSAAATALEAEKQKLAAAVANAEEAQGQVQGLQQQLESSRFLAEVRQW